MNAVWEKLLEKIKKVLEKDFNLDMDGTDERLAYLIYVISMGEKEVRKLPRQWITEALALAPVDYWRKEKPSFIVFQRGIYKSLHRIYDNYYKDLFTFDFFTVLNFVLEAVK